MKIVMIDDAEDILKIGKLSLEAVGGHSVMTFELAESGIEFARTSRPDVILLDMMMPAMDGLEALGRILGLEELKAVPVVFMTAKVQMNERRQYVAKGAAGVIQKPFDPMTLASEVESIVADFRAGFPSSAVR